MPETQMDGGPRRKQMRGSDACGRCGLAQQRRRILFSLATRLATPAPQDSVVTVIAKRMLKNYGTNKNDGANV